MSTNEMENTARTYRELQAEIKTLEEQADALKQIMIGEMDTKMVDKLTAGAFTIHYNLYESSRLDAARLKADHADLYQQYTKRTASVRFMVA